MRLLLVSHYMPPHHGGIERIGEDHAWAARDAGFEVTWVASRVPATGAEREVMPWGRAVRVPCLNQLEDRLAVPYPLWLPGAAGVVDACVGEADIIHAHDLLYPGTSLAFASATKRKVPTLLTQHVGFVPYASRSLSALQSLAFRTIGRRNAARASAAAYYNDVALATLRDRARCVRPAVFLPNPVDDVLFHPVPKEIDKYELRLKHNLPTDRAVVLFVGRLVPKKGADLVLRAIEPDYHTLFIAERGTVSIGDRQGIELRAFVERERLAELMRAADVLVLPAFGEGFPLVVQEAMASGLPVILGEDPGYLRQLEQDALITVRREVAPLRGAIRALVDDPHRRLIVGRRARASALSLWGREGCRQRLIDLYRLLARGELPVGS